MFSVSVSVSGIAIGGGSVNCGVKRMFVYRYQVLSL